MNRTHVLTLCHSDESSGLTLLSDGTKVYWTEGRSSYLTVIDPNGIKTEQPVWEPSDINDLLQEFSERGNEPSRQMTAAEETEYDATRRPRASRHS